MTDALTDFSRLCLHTITTKHWTLRETIDQYSQAGIPGVTVWRQALEPYGPETAGRMLKDSGLKVVSLCRGGFFPAHTSEARSKAIDDNRRAIEEAHHIGAPLIVLVWLGVSILVIGGLIALLRRYLEGRAVLAGERVRLPKGLPALGQRLGSRGTGR